MSRGPEDRKQGKHQKTVKPLIQRDTTCSTVVIWVKIIQNELMVEIYSKSRVGIIGKVSRMKSS